MDIKKIRFSNIKHLANIHGRPRIAACHPEGKWDSNYINQLCSGHGSFGAATARLVERGLNLPEGWMDTLHPEVAYSDSGQIDPYKTEMILMWEKLPPEKREQLLRIAKSL